MSSQESAEYASQAYRDAITASIIGAVIRPPKERPPVNTDGPLKRFKDTGRGVLGPIGPRLPDLVVGKDELPMRQKSPALHVENLELRDAGKGALGVTDQLPRLYVFIPEPEAEPVQAVLPEPLEHFMDLGKGALNLPIRGRELVVGDRGLAQRVEPPGYELIGIDQEFRDIAKGVLSAESPPLEPDEVIDMQGVPTPLPSELVEPIKYDQTQVLGDGESVLLPGTDEGTGTVNEAIQEQEWDVVAEFEEFLSSPDNEGAFLSDALRASLTGLYVKYSLAALNPVERAAVRHFLGLRDSSRWVSAYSHQRQPAPKTLAQLRRTLVAFKLQLDGDELNDYLVTLIRKLSSVSPTPGI